jgi:AraC-like DNA-binding protein
VLNHALLARIVEAGRLLRTRLQSVLLKSGFVCDSLGDTWRVCSLQCGFDSNAATSRVWLTPDLAFGFHHFSYSNTQYDGLAHTHPEYCVILCLSGAIKVIQGDKLDVLGPGEILIIGPGDRHRCCFGVDNQQSHGLTFILQPAVLRSFLEAVSLPCCLLSRDFQFLGKGGSGEAFELVPKLIDEFRNRRRGYRTMIETLARQILIHLFRDWRADAVLPLQRDRTPELPWPYMHRATEYMNAHGKGVFRLSDLCVNVGISASRFIPLFRNSSGLSPHSYYNSLLVFKARRLLQSEGSSTKETAYSLGFRNVSHFCSLFHQLTGFTPSSVLAMNNDVLTPFEPIEQRR